MQGVQDGKMRWGKGSQILHWHGELLPKEYPAKTHETQPGSFGLCLAGKPVHGLIIDSHLDLPAGLSTLILDLQIAWPLLDLSHEPLLGGIPWGTHLTEQPTLAPP